MERLSKNKIKTIRSLQQKKYRNELGCYVVEGEKMVEELIDEHSELIDFLVITESYSLPEAYNGELFLASEKELSQCSSLKTPNKVLAVVRINTKPISASAFIIALDGVQDPGNMGTIMRLADWYGIDQIICSESTVDAFNPKVVQATMGAIFRIDIQYVDLEHYLKTTDHPIYGAVMNGENVYEKTLTPNGIIVMGNEGNGVSKPIESLVQHPLTIPKKGKAESLNVSIATGILLSEFYRGEF